MMYHERQKRFKVIEILSFCKLVYNFNNFAVICRGILFNISKYA